MAETVHAIYRKPKVPVQKRSLALAACPLTPTIEQRCWTPVHCSRRCTCAVVRLPAQNVAVTRAAMLPSPTYEHRTYPCPFDFGKGQAQSGNRSPGNAGQTSWPAAEEPAGRHRDDRYGQGRSEKEKRHDPCQTESPVRADEGVLGEAQKAVSEGVALGALSVRIGLGAERPDLRSEELTHGPCHRAPL